MDGTRPLPFTTAMAVCACLVLLGGCASGASDAPNDEVPIPASTGNTPEGSGHRLGPDDLLEVRVFGAEELSGELRVTSAGSISMPLLGPVEAKGLTPGELEGAIREGLADRYMRDPQVSVQVLEAHAREVATVYVVGEVRSPGGFPLERGEPVTVIQALALAEGLAPTASSSRAKIVREGEGENPEEVPLDLGQILDGETEDPLLRHRDVLVVPSSRPRALVRGAWDAFLRMFRLRDLR